ncbi:MAG: dicarboxylate/amino acid:cation symporter, partial [Candidatus Kapaibacterium sp.]
MTSHAPSSRFSLSLAQQIFLGMFVGGLIGWLQPQWGTDLFFLRDIFLNLIKSIIAPLVFSTIVVGIAGSGGAKNVGRMGFRSLLYFEIVTTLALVIGLVVVNLTQPGVGIQLNGTSDAVQTIAQTQPKTLIQTLVHVFPSSIVDALLR